MLTPEKCPICNAEWRGGATLPGTPLTNGSVFYDCGGKVWQTEIYTTPTCILGYLMHVTNCITLFPDAWWRKE